MTSKKPIVIVVKKRPAKKPIIEACKDFRCARCDMDLPVLIDEEKNAYIDCQIVDNVHMNGEVQSNHIHLCPQCMQELKYILKTGILPPPMIAMGTVH